MLNVEQIENDKDKILQENVLPNVCWNRFDLRYGTDYDLSKIVIPDRTRKNFTVSKKGYAGSNITLEIIEGSSVISINDNTCS